MSQKDSQIENEKIIEREKMAKQGKRDGEEKGGCCGGARPPRYSRAWCCVNTCSALHSCSVGMRWKALSPVQPDRARISWSLSTPMAFKTAPAFTASLYAHATLHMCVCVWMGVGVRCGHLCALVRVHARLQRHLDSAAQDNIAEMFGSELMHRMLIAARSDKSAETVFGRV